MPVLSLLCGVLLAVPVIAPHPAPSSPEGAARSEAPPENHVFSAEEISKILYPPVRYGTFTPVVGEWVDYRVKLNGQSETSLLRFSVVQTVELDGVLTYQIEISVPEVNAQAITAFWMTPAPDAVVTRQLLWIPPHTPLSIPLDILPTRPELQGKLISQEEIRLSALQSSAVRSLYEHLGASVEVVTSEKIPLWHVYSFKRKNGEEWTYAQTGHGARTTLSSVPMQIPRFSDYQNNLKRIQSLPSFSSKDAQETSAP